MKLDEDTYSLLRPLFRLIIDRSRPVDVRNILRELVDSYVDDDACGDLAKALPYFVRYLNEYPEPLLVGPRLVAWAPKGILAPLELLAAKVPTGSVTEREWVERLADRVTEMASKEPPEVTTQACRALGLPETDDPAEAGQYLVMGNLNLRTHLTLAMDSNPFPAMASEDEEAARAIEETDFWTWVDLAASMVSASSLD